MKKLISLLLAWCLSMRARIVQKQVQRLLMCVGGLLAFWVLVRVCKWEFVMSVYDALRVIGEEREALERLLKRYARG